MMLKWFFCTNLISSNTHSATCSVCLTQNFSQSSRFLSSGEKTRSRIVSRMILTQQSVKNCRYVVLKTFKVIFSATTIWFSQSGIWAWHVRGTPYFMQFLTICLVMLWKTLLFLKLITKGKNCYKRSTQEFLISMCSFERFITTD